MHTGSSPPEVRSGLAGPQASTPSDKRALSLWLQTFGRPLFCCGLTDSNTSFGHHCLFSLFDAKDSALVFRTVLLYTPPLHDVQPTVYTVLCTLAICLLGTHPRQHALQLSHMVACGLHSRYSNWIAISIRAACRIPSRSNGSHFATMFLFENPLCKGQPFACKTKNLQE